VAAGADALLIEIHPNADKSVSDAAQTMYLEDFAKLTAELRVRRGCRQNTVRRSGTKPDPNTKLGCQSCHF
jgi:3-deoxy-7-phosphoheptulonate synthase